MGKPVAVRVASDDCVVTIAGVEYHPHEGEWVEAIPGIVVGDLRVLRQLVELKVKLDALQGEDNEQAQSLALQDDSLQGVVGILRRMLTAWSWTDDRGQAYPQPGEDPSVFARLRIDELYYLMTVVRGDAPRAEKNALRPSPTTSLATPPRRSRTSRSGGRSPTRAASR